MSVVDQSLRAPFAAMSAQMQYVLDRFDAEAQFAEALCVLHPAQAAAWGPLLAEARATMSAAVAQGSLEALRAALGAAETTLAPLGATAKGYTLHGVGHAHIDMNWMWSWPETVAIINDSFSTMLRLMDEFPDFTFSQSQASTYAAMERHNPALLERIAARVREGRWEVTASHWVEGEKNIAGGESLCRHLLYTRAYMQQLFGLAPEDVTIDWAPDTFGHPASMPTYLTRGGVKYSYLHRPGCYTAPRPELFWWQAPDGARVLVRNDMKQGYNGRIYPGVIAPMIDYLKLTQAQDYMVVYGVGDHGGGPTRRDLRCAVDMASWPIFPVVKFSTAAAYFQQVEKLGDTLPTHIGELNTEVTGCYTTQTLIKKCNRFGEARLYDAEVAASVAHAGFGQPYAQDLFVEAWRDTLFNHFHDILPGSGVHDTRTYTHGLFQKTMATTGQIETQALRRLAAEIDTSAAASAALPELPPTFGGWGLGAGVGFNTKDGGLAGYEPLGAGHRPIMLFNPLAWERRDVAQVQVWDQAQGVDTRPLHERSYSAEGPDGVRVPAQVVTHGNYWGHEYVTLTFPVTVPGLGYALYIVREEDIPASAASTLAHLGYTHHCYYLPAERGELGLENGALRVEIDPHTGGIRHLVEKASGAEIVSDAPLLEYAVERRHGMTAWTIAHTGAPEYPQVVEIRRGQLGPHSITLDVEMRIHESNFTLTYELREGDPRLYLHLRGVWFQRGTPETGIPSLSAVFPLNLQDTAGRYEIPFGALDRPYNNGDELPALEWAQVTGTLDGTAAGCLLMNDSKHGYALDGNVLRLSLIRSPYDPDILPEVMEHEVHLALLPFTGTHSSDAATRAARELNHPLRVIATDVHTGTLPAQESFAAITPANVILSGLKRAEDGSGLIVRVYDIAGQATTAEITLHPTLLGRLVSAQEVDLLERPLAASSAKTQGQTVTVTVPARGIASVLLRLG
ncbi:MAG TPA: glycoside hydrolase family 38 C-terminal domain-containing protein [Armatimonadota bacterium]|jgi:alpha-mannosidase